MESETQLYQLQQKLEQVKKEKNEAIVQQRYDDATLLREKQHEVEEALRKLTVK